MSIPWADITAIVVNTTEKPAKDGQRIYTFAPTLHFRAQNYVRSITLAKWSDEERAVIFVDWLLKNVREPAGSSAG